MKDKLTTSDYRRAAASLGCSVAAVVAVANVESPRGPFLDDGRPSLLFERHKFHKHTRGRFSAAHPDISSSKPGGYGAEGAHQHARMERAAKLDRDAALKSASWGAFQILGENHEQAGHRTLQAFVNAMYRSASSQLDCFINFIRNDSRLLAAIRGLQWATFARIYNGPAYRDNDYDVKMAREYAAALKEFPDFRNVVSGVTSTEPTAK